MTGQGSRWNVAEFTHSLANVHWMASTAVLMHLNERTTGDPARNWLTSWAHRYFAGEGLRVLVLGCGEGWLERGIAGWPFIASIDAVDNAADAVERARAQAPANVQYDIVDLNTASLQRGAYDVVVAHSILHHIENLEHALGEIERAMKPDATLIVNEYAGPNRFQFRDDVLAIMNGIMACLPERLRRGEVEQRTHERRERPPLDVMIAADPTEAVRAEELVPMIEERFEVLDRKMLGGTILMHLLYDIVQNFRFDDPRERAYLEMICAFEGALVDSGAIPSDYVILVARRRSSRVTAAPRPLPPRSEAAKDVEGDPLGFGGAARVPRAGGGRHRRPSTLQPWMLRILRVALVARRERRANLIRESRLKAWIETTRCRASGLAPFEWIGARWSAHDDDPVIAALLETFGRVWQSRR
ncbi:MAG TPA: class I SAM-dependent methyltransferase [Thermoanaerobaculia bacterium]|nr:class I SAM-dependent methyltransferase [Thermoanaerobaculia bacterium]